MISVSNLEHNFFRPIAFISYNFKGEPNFYWYVILIKYKSLFIIAFLLQ